MMNIDNLKRVQFLRSLALRWRLFCSKHSYKNGRGNKLFCRGIKISTKIQIDGNNNTIEIAAGAVLSSCLIKISGNNNQVIIGTDAYIEGAELWIEDNHQEINIGSKTYIGHNTHLACTEDGHKILIGSNCMISSNVQIRTGDSHSILSIDQRRINPARDVIVSDHCWLGQGARVLKGVMLGKDSIVAQGAIVTGSFESNVIVAGVPAKVVKNNVSWDSRRL